MVNQSTLESIDFINEYLMEGDNADIIYLQGICYDISLLFTNENEKLRYF